MKKNLKLPTLLGVLILFSGLIAGIFLINSSQVFKLSANIEAIPKNVRFSNIINTGLTISWTTDVESKGFVKWGTKQNSLSKVALEENSEKSFVHSVNIIGSEIASDVFLKINSDTKDYDNEGTVWQTKTSINKISPSSLLIASGSILMADGKSPAKALVYLTINGIVLSGITSNEGSFIIPVSTYIETVSDTTAIGISATAIEISVNAGLNGTSQAVIYPKAIKSIPTMIIGKTYDFRSLTTNDSNDEPKSSLSIPESVAISSRFEITKTETAQAISTVTIDSIDNGEIITTTDPEFFGKGPQNTSIEIAVESELQEVALVTDAKGAWKWNPPNNLEPGEHKVTVKWRDASGILRTITRNFVVSASEGPAFESTPSATPHVASTSSPSATPKATKTPTTTAPPTPETGSPTQTIGLFLIGVGLFLSSLYLHKRPNVN